MRILLAALLVAIIAMWSWPSHAQSCKTPDQIIEKVQAIADKGNFTIHSKIIKEDGEDRLLIVARHRAAFWKLDANGCTAGGGFLRPQWAAETYFGMTLDELFGD